MYSRRYMAEILPIRRETQNNQSVKVVLCKNKTKIRTDLDVIRTRNLLIWSQTRYRCATKSYVTNVFCPEAIVPSYIINLFDNVFCTLIKAVEVLISSVHYLKNGCTWICRNRVDFTEIRVHVT